MVHGSSRWPWRSWSGWRVGICLAVLGGCLSWPVNANEPPPLPLTLPEWVASLQRLDSLSTLLRQKLEDSRNHSAALRQEVESLQSQLDLLGSTLRQLEERLRQAEQHSQALVEDLALSTANLATLRTSLRVSSQNFDVLWQAWSTYKAEAEGQIAGLERRARAWRAVGISALALGAIGWLVALLT